MKGALCEGLPVIIAMELGTNFYYLEGDLEDQKYNAVNKSNNRTIGHHAMNVVGYSDKLQGYIVENSWGESWGDQGLCLIPYDVFDANATDAWVCTQFEYNYSDDYKLEEPEESFFDKVKMWFRNVVRKIQGWF